MKRGYLNDLVLAAAHSLMHENKLINTENLVNKTGKTKLQVTPACLRLVNNNKLRRVSIGVYDLVTLTEADLLPEPKQDENSIYKLFDALNNLPDLVLNAMDSIIELVIEPEVEIMNLLDRRNTRITNLEVLLSKAKIDATNMRAKISELQNNINKIQSQKNRVIPEEIIKFRNNH